MTGDRGHAPRGSEWRWTLTSGFVTLALAVVAFFLPDIDWLPTAGIVGWLLVLAGAVELAFGWRRGLDALGEAAVGSGVITAISGLVFVVNPLAGHFPLANVVTAWLGLRGAWVLAMALRLRSRRLTPWLALSGITDVLLAIGLLNGLRAAALVYLLFGPTREIVATFSLFLAGSFLVTAISQIAIALIERRRSR